ncbi:hypothetical protein [Siminovitchia terrae]|uniref:hypothetical protein n=1 Tax=Siminovitchia terrae TaxID=1914933 RepID=UPI0028AAEC21|nr:hypothetical protein [Siminovitchia terrae]
MSQNQKRLLLANLRMEYLQKILYPELIVVEPKKNMNEVSYSEIHSVLDENIKEFERTLKDDTFEHQKQASFV